MLLSQRDEIKRSNEMAKTTWETKAVGSQRSNAPPGSMEYFDEIRNYRYGYETPFIPSVFNFFDLKSKRVIEIGVGHGIDAGEMMKFGASYVGLDVTKNHINLAKLYLKHLNNKKSFKAGFEFHYGDLLDFNSKQKFDVAYSFGVLHHISHEKDYLRKIRQILKDDGELRVSFYSKYSFFNAWLIFTWLVKNRLKTSLDDWRSHIAEGSELGKPVVIKIRSKKQIERLLVSEGFKVVSYAKRGFVQNYIPIFGKMLRPNGKTLTFCGCFLGWYHCFVCKPV